MSKKFEVATINYYIDWLRGFFAKGGEPTHYYDYPWARADFLLARGDFRLGGECGALSRSILVPMGVRCLGGSLGHNNLYFQSDFEEVGGWVPIYNDREFNTLPKDVTDPFMAKQMAEKEALDAYLKQYETDEVMRSIGSDLTEYRHMRNR